MPHVVPEFTVLHAILALALVPIFITVMSLVREPIRQNLYAVIIAAAGSVYSNHCLGVWEQVFSAVMIFMAYKGLANYRYIAVAWIFHALFDIPHHFFAVPLDPAAPFSSAVCFIFDPLIAIWFFFGAPTVFTFFTKNAPVSPAGGVVRE